MEEKAKRILIVDDEPRIRALIAQYARLDGYDYEEAEDGDIAVKMATDPRTQPFDLIVMDVMMPRMDGLTAMRRIRVRQDIPVLLLTAKGEEYDRVLGFDLGADDYLVKPFSPRELMARVRVLLRRRSVSDSEKKKSVPELYHCQSLTINMTAHEVLVDDKPVTLTPKEYEVLVFFVENRGEVIDRETLLHRVWGYQEDVVDIGVDTRTVDTHIKTLRNKLGDNRNLIRTVWGVGYRYEG